MSFSNRLPDLALKTILQFLTLKEIENLLEADPKLKRALHKDKSRFYQSPIIQEDIKLLDDIASRISRAKIDWMFIVDKNNNIKYFKIQ